MRNWLRMLKAAALAAGIASTGGLAAEEAPASIKIGYVVSLTGANAESATITTVPNYRLWIADVNQAGGLLLKKYGKRVRIETIEIDDRSDNAEMLREIERLMAVEKVDFVLPPSGTAENLLAAPLFHRHGYPQIAGAAGSDDMDRLTSRYSTLFFFLGGPREQAEATVEFLSEQVKKGTLRNTVALLTVQHPFGAAYLAAAKPALAKAGFNIVYETAYAPGVSDLSAEIEAAKTAEPDILLAWSRPADTHLITEQSISSRFNPRFKLVSAGGASPTYKSKFRDRIDGWFSLGGVDLSAPGVKSWSDRHRTVNKVEPDRWAGLNTYAALEVLQQAIERVGETDRTKIMRELHAGTFRTLLGEFSLKNNRNPNLWQVGQWQRGELYGVAPVDRPGARAPVFPRQGR